MLPFDKSVSFLLQAILRRSALRPTAQFTFHFF